ncbi:MAG: undecaprenyl-phosphate glucose phosphotransferase [Rhodospirillales bacterium]|jgi:Undecaprenyl-phosphate glucose phosphotransferase|nr:undecaprenyl-phosphate glucose phosphotransferase [Rhodospirillales bacterium]
MAHNGLLLSRLSRFGRRSKAGGDEVELRPSRPYSLAMVCSLLLPLDIAVLAASAAAAYAFWLVGDPYSLWTKYGLVAAFGTLLAINFFYLAGLYQPDILKQPGTAVRRTAACWLSVAAVMVAAGFLSKTSEDYSRLWAMTWFGLGLAALLGLRWLFFVQAARWTAQGRLQRTVAIIGTGPLATRLADHFAANPADGIRVAGVFSDENRPVSPSTQLPARRGGNLVDLIARVRRGAIDTIIIALPKISERRLLRILDQFAELPIDIRLCPGPTALRLMQGGISHYANIPMFNLANRPLADWRYAAKEIEDRLLAPIILLMIAPLLLVIAAVIRLDSPGPVLFRQKRYGYNNQLIEVFKFRTMYHERQDLRGEQLTQRDDPRVTPVGKMLRRWSLDELPQFLNVLRGEMSIVGPRPHAVSAKAAGLLYQEAVARYGARHRVKPGITGWAQINGWRGPTDTVRQIQKRVEHDLYYIENWSLWLDFKIILLTPFKGLIGHNAY